MWKFLSLPLQTINSLYDRTFPAEEYDNKECDDNCALMYLNEATLLNNIRIRYMKNQIYVSTQVLSPVDDDSNLE